ncbi:MAG: hypothetical protein M1817_005154 [Caeruleum heppii]|nr:MAG: hypothetical protein M1817_005154 [Caeruleum heppii]
MAAAILERSATITKPARPSAALPLPFSVREEAVVPQERSAVPPAAVRASDQAAAPGTIATTPPLRSAARTVFARLETPVATTAAVGRERTARWMENATEPRSTTRTRTYDYTYTTDTTPTNVAGGSATKGAKATVTFEHRAKQTVLYRNNRKKYDVNNDALMINMCEGMRKLAGKTTQTVQLTVSRTTRDVSRAAMCPKGFCEEVNIAYDTVHDVANLRVQFKFTCDEFPFANTLQGGSLASGTVKCVSGWENSYQGGKLSRKLKNLNDGDDYVIVIEGWDCDKQVPTGRRSGTPKMLMGRDEPLDVEDDMNGDDLFTNFTDGSNAMILSLGDLDAGSYSYNLSLKTGSFSEATVVDYLGEELANVEAAIVTAPSDTVLNFTLEKPGIGIGLVVLTESDQITMGVAASNRTEISSAGSSASASGSGGSSSDAGRLRCGDGGWGIYLLVGVAGVSVLLGGTFTP